MLSGLSAGSCRRAPRKLSHGEGRGEREAFDARARPGEEDRSSSMGRHALRRLLSHVEATQSADGNSLFDCGRIDFCDRTMRPGTGVVDDNVGFAEALVDLVEEHATEFAFDTSVVNVIACVSAASADSFPTSRAARPTFRPSSASLRARDALMPGPAPTISAVP